MSALRNEINLVSVATNSVSESFLKDIIAKQFWLWYRSHIDDKIITIKIFVISKTIRVHDLHPLFVLLFGDEPILTDTP